MLEHLVFATTFFGSPFPQQGGLITNDRLVVGTSDDLVGGSPVWAGDQIIATFDSQGVVYTNIVIHVLYEQPVDLAQVKSLTTDERVTLLQNGACGRIVCGVNVSRSSPAPFLFLVAETSDSSSLVPLRRLTPSEAEAFAVAGADDFFEDFPDEMQADLVLLAAHDLGIQTRTDFYRTETIASLVDVPVEDRPTYNALLQTQVLSKRCECDCNGDDMIVVPPDISTTDPTSEACAAFELALQKAQDCRTAAHIAAAACLATLTVALALIVIAACLLASGPAFLTCLRVALKAAMNKLGKKLLGILTACAAGYGACLVSCYAKLLSDRDRICICLCSNQPATNCFDPFDTSCVSPIVP